MDAWHYELQWGAFRRDSRVLIDGEAVAEGDVDVREVLAAIPPARVARMQRTIAAWAHVMHYGQGDAPAGGYDGVDFLFRALADANDALAAPWTVAAPCEDADFGNLLLSVGKQMRAANVSSCAGLVARFGCTAPLPLASHQVKQDSGHVSRLTGADLCHVSCGLCAGVPQEKQQQQQQQQGMKENEG